MNRTVREPLLSAAGRQKDYLAASTSAGVGQGTGTTGSKLHPVTISAAERDTRAEHINSPDVILLPELYLVAYSSHSHTLFYHERGVRDPPNFGCDWCKHDYTMWSDEPRYSCDKCRYDVCISCAQEVDKRYRLNADGIPVAASDGTAAYIKEVCFAFSGGGIRSASFCSGALRSFISLHSTAPRLMSSVSGGGYLASSFLHWSRVHSLAGVPAKDWASSYFAHFHSHVGYFVGDWFAPPLQLSILNGLWRVAYMITRIFLWFTTVCLITASPAFPYAILISTFFGPLLQPSATGWTVYAPLLCIAACGLACIVADSALSKWRPSPASSPPASSPPADAAVVSHRSSASSPYRVAAPDERQQYWLGVKQRLRSFLWLVTVALILLVVLLLLSRSSLLVFFVVWVVLMVIVNVLMEPGHNMGWNIILLASWLCYWYACVLTWYANRHGETDQQGRLLRTDEPLNLLFLYNLHFRSFDHVPMADESGYYTVIGYGLLVMRYVVLLSASIDLLLTFRDMILPLYYRDSLTNAFYYRPLLCHCDSDGRCRAYRAATPLDRSVEGWSKAYDQVGFEQHFKRDFVEFGFLVAVTECIVRTLRRALYGILWGPVKLLVSAVPDTQQRSAESSARLRRWHEWCLHKATLLQTWDELTLPLSTVSAGSSITTSAAAAAATGVEPPTELLSGAAVEHNGVTEWLCVTTLNERSQYAGRPNFDQFLLKTGRASNDDRVFGEPLSLTGLAHRMREAVKPDSASMRCDQSSDTRPDTTIRRLHVRTSHEMGLHDGMSLSAAAISFGMGTYASSFAAIRGLQGLNGLLGLSLSKTVQAVAFSRLLWEKGLCPVVLHTTHLALILVIACYALPLAEAPNGSGSELWWLSCLLACLVVAELFVVTMWDSDGVELVPMYRAARQLIGLGRIPENVDNPGSLDLTDGGHTENFGLLPLLAQRQKLIVLCDGGADPNQQMKDLTSVLSNCRQVWGIRFRVMLAGIEDRLLRTTYDDYDLQEDISAWANRKPYNEQHRQLVLKIFIQYPHLPDTGSLDKPNNDEVPASTGLLLYLKPREHVSPTDDSRLLYGGCCQCCHQPACCGWKYLCGEFPHHSTANQFFTPKMQKHYESEGQLAFKSAERWIRLWQRKLDTAAQLAALNLQDSRWFGATKWGADSTDMVRVTPVTALIRSVQVVGKYNIRGVGFHISGLCMLYSKSDGTQQEIVHGSRNLTEDEEKKGTRMVSETMVVPAGQHIVSVHIKSGQVIDDLCMQLSGSGAAPSNWLSPDKVSYFDQEPEENHVAFHRKSLYRVHNRRPGDADDKRTPINALRFKFAVPPQQGVTLAGS